MFIIVLSKHYIESLTGCCISVIANLTMEPLTLKSDTKGVLTKRPRVMSLEWEYVKFCQHVREQADERLSKLIQKEQIFRALLL